MSHRHVGAEHVLRHGGETAESLGQIRTREDLRGVDSTARAVRLGCGLNEFEDEIGDIIDAAVLEVWVGDGEREAGVCDCPADVLNGAVDWDGEGCQRYGIAAAGRGDLWWW